MEIKFNSENGQTCTQGLVSSLGHRGQKICRDGTVIFLYDNTTVPETGPI